MFSARASIFLHEQSLVWTDMPEIFPGAVVALTNRLIGIRHDVYMYVGTLLVHRGTTPWDELYTAYILRFSTHTPTPRGPKLSLQPLSLGAGLASPSITRTYGRRPRDFKVGVRLFDNGSLGGIATYWTHDQAGGMSAGRVAISTATGTFQIGIISMICFQMHAHVFIISEEVALVFLIRVMWSTNT